MHPPVTQAGQIIRGFQSTNNKGCLFSLSLQQKLFGGHETNQIISQDKPAKKNEKRRISKQKIIAAHDNESRHVKIFYSESLVHMYV
jgi:hypothetical protein